jgi:2-phosphosulfolactate phosphatase
MSTFDQRQASCRCEWGASGLDALAPADVVIVVDVLSFSTCVDIAVSRGAVVLPYEWKNESSTAFAGQQRAELAGPRETSRYSLSPSSFADAPAGLRCVLPSPNGAALSRRAAATSAVVLTGCLRNAKAIARRAQRLGRTFNVCPAGERWPDGSLRPSLEDFIGAGAILRHLPGPKSPEAEAAIAVFEYRQHLLGETIARSSSGRELIERGFPQDVEIASALDVSTQAPTFDALAFTA